jgi:hypothetical protein
MATTGALRAVWTRQSRRSVHTTCPRASARTVSDISTHRSGKHRQSRQPHTTNTSVQSSSRLRETATRHSDSSARWTASSGDSGRSGARSRRPRARTEHQPTQQGQTTILPAVPAVPAMTAQHSPGGTHHLSHRQRVRTHTTLELRRPRRPLRGPRSPRTSGATRRSTHTPTPSPRLTLTNWGVSIRWSPLTSRTLPERTTTLTTPIFSDDR